MLSDHIIVGQKLERCFRCADPRVVAALTGLYISGLMVLLMAGKLMHHTLDLPSLPYLWQLLMSLCS